MSKSITPSTYVRCIGYKLMMQLADFIDPQEGWKKLAVDIKDPSGEKRYNQMHIRRFEGLIKMGKSPTCELLYDWGTANCTVGDLVELLIRNHFLAPASLLLPDAVRVADDIMVPFSSQETMPIDKTMPVQEKTVISATPLLAQSSEGQLSAPSCLSQENNSLQLSDTGFHSFWFHELKNVTNNFDERPISAGGNKLGEGGFGVVYKGYVNGRIVAVKKLAAMVDVSIQDLKQQFDQEIKTMAKCQHENLVELLGFSGDGDQPCLVYEYMPNGSLLDRLACLVLLEIITGLSPIDENREPQLLLSIKEEIEDEEKTIEDYVDEKMSDWDTISIDKMYSVASQCLNEKKNKRPDIKMVQQHLQEIIA
ncbi:interleukin-1 receptor-associated kinase 4 isoform X2 [Mauremys reevesii]|uniref:interleukin-1 receptor-associated kinase 4 isoform X2 n=1 Tax=Mauremys reevesii TaxID=260615 RepID=UPI00193F3EF2|nr:interleukin-1 receptor-associated kinase 4 isoform X2 [Mauremys reevesii]